MIDAAHGSTGLLRQPLGPCSRGPSGLLAAPVRRGCPRAGGARPGFGLRPRVSGRADDGARCARRRDRRVLGRAGAHARPRHRRVSSRPRHGILALCGRHVRHRRGQLEPRASVLHASPHPRMRALRQTGREVHLARAEHRALAIPDVAALRSFPLRPEQPNRRVPHPLRYGVRGEAAVARCWAHEDPHTRSRRNVGARPLSPAAREQVHEALRRPAVRAARAASSFGVCPLPLLLRGETSMKLETLTDRKRFTRRLKQKANMAAKYVSYELELERAPTFPDRVYVESTNVCNLDCIMCPTGLHIDTRPKGFMECDLYTEIIDEIAPFAQAVVLHSWGEPLLHSRIIDMISYAKE